MITEDIKNAYDRTKWALIFRGLLGIALGILIILRPLTSVEVFALVIAVWALADGLVNIVHAFDLRRVAPHWWALLLAGCISAASGSPRSIITPPCRSPLPSSGRRSG